MINVTNTTCTGCRACEQKCPRHCINMVPDHEGFLIAVVNHNLCINCHICENICPIVSGNSKPECDSAVAFHLDDKNVNSLSTSGGAFAALARLVLDKSGIVFGAAFTEINRVEHIEIICKENLYLLQGSKYVQSNTKDTFSRVQKYLEQNRTVLYSGTACQISGLKAFLGRNYENLICVDVICHGVSSPLLFEKYISWIQLNRGKILSYQFRTKSKAGWGNYGKIVFEKGEKYISSNDPYIKSYMAGRNYRECCYSCLYANRFRVSDLTLGDFWGVQKSYPNLYRKDGVSLILINTAKGRALLDELSCSGSINKINLSDVLPYQTNLNQPTHRPFERTSFYEGINCLDIDLYMKNKLQSFVTIKDRIHGLLPVGLKYRIKRILKSF